MQICKQKLSFLHNIIWLIYSKTKIEKNNILNKKQKKLKSSPVIKSFCIKIFIFYVSNKYLIDSSGYYLFAGVCVFFSPENP